MVYYILCEDALLSTLYIFHLFTTFNILSPDKKLIMIRYFSFSCHLKFARNAKGYYLFILRRARSVSIAFSTRWWKCQCANNVAMIYDYRRNKLHVAPLFLLAAHLRAAAAQRLHPYWVNTPRVRSISSPCRDTSVHRRSDLLTYKRRQVAENEDTGLVRWKPDRRQRAARWDRIRRFSSALDDCRECMMAILMLSPTIVADKSSLCAPDIKVSRKNT